MRYVLDLTLIILAAGIGKRFGGNKQIESVGPNGEFILHYSVFDALRAGFTRIVLVIRPDLQEILHREFQRLSFPTHKIAYIEQDPHHLPEGLPAAFHRQKPWGTAHATWVCHSLVHTPFAVINADDFYGRHAYGLLADFLSTLTINDRKYGLVGYPIHKTLSKHGSVSRAVCNLDAGGFLTSIKERSRIILHGSDCFYENEHGESLPLPSETCVSMNSWAFTPIFFQDLKRAMREFFTRPGFDAQNSEFYLPDMVGDLLQQQKARVKVLPTTQSWFGITYPQDSSTVRTAIQEFIQCGDYPVDLYKNVTWQ